MSALLGDPDHQVLQLIQICHAYIDTVLMFVCFGGVEGSNMCSTCVFMNVTPTLFDYCICTKGYNINTCLIFIPLHMSHMTHLHK